MAPSRRLAPGAAAWLALPLLVVPAVADPAQGDPPALAAPPAIQEEGRPMLAIDAARFPQARFRIDSVPDSARAEFEAAMRRNMEFIRGLPGFLGNAVFERVAGPTSFNVTTVTAWRDQEALEGAAARVGAWFRQIGFDRAATLARLGVKAEIGTFVARTR